MKINPVIIPIIKNALFKPSPIKILSFIFCNQHLYIVTISVIIVIYKVNGDNMKKIIFIISILLILIVSGCSSNPTGKSTSNEQTDLEIIVLDKDTLLSSEQCTARGLNKKIIMLESEYCGHCKIIEPILKEIEQEKNINILFLDISKKEDRTKMEDFGIFVKYTPTLLVGCNVLIGSKEKSEYEAIIDEFLKD